RRGDAMRVRRSRWTLCLALSLLAGCTGASPTSPAASTEPSASTTSSAVASDGKQDPALFAAQVRARSAEAGVSPQLVMSILYNESHKPHDPQLEREWQKLKPDTAFGIANIDRKS